MKNTNGNRVWVLSELYYPEETSTGHYVTAIAEHWSQQMNVAVLCVQPSYSKAGVRSPRREEHNGVNILRCRAWLPKSKAILSRLVKMVSISCSLFLNAWLRVRREDCLFVVTNPPTLPIVAWLLSWVRGVRYVLLVYDLYPDVLAACGLTKTGSITYRLLKWINRAVLRRASRVVAIGRDMQERIQTVAGIDVERHVNFIPLWSDCAEIRPESRAANSLIRELGLAEKFVVLHAGNMGYPQNIETIAQVVEQLASDESIHFLFIGSGPKVKLLEELVSSGHTNLTVLPAMPRTKQQEFLNACDISILSLLPGMLGISVPSRTYNLMAAGKPILALIARSSETARMIEDFKVGWVVPQHEPGRILAAIRAAQKDKEAVRQIGLRARAVAESEFSRERILKRFDDLMVEVQ